MFFGDDYMEVAGLIPVCRCATKVNDSTSQSLKHRLVRASGHLAYVKKMLDEDRNLGDILFQLEAVKASVKICANLILEQHLQGCSQSENSDRESLAELLQEVLELLHRSKTDEEA